MSSSYEAMTKSGHRSTRLGATSLSISCGLSLACALLLGCDGPRTGPGLEPPSGRDGGVNQPGVGAPGSPSTAGMGSPGLPRPGDVGGTAGSAAPVGNPMTGGDTPEPDADAGSEDGGLPDVPVPPPEAVGCIAQVGAGLRRFECDGISHDLAVPERCLQTQCGLVIDVHGGTMSSRMENKNTDMQRLGAEHGFVVLQPSAAANLWNAESDDAKVHAFANDVVRAYHLDPRRIHMMGFSQGGYMTWRFVCKHSDWLGSAAPAAAAGEANISVEVGCSFGADDKPARPVPVFYMHGRLDGMVDFDNALALRDAVREAYGAGDGEPMASGTGFTRTRYRGEDGVLFEFLEHDYSSPSMVGVPPLGVAIAGHCYPGSEDLTPSEPDQLMAFGCTPPNSFHWGEQALRFFIAHPKAE